MSDKELCCCPNTQCGNKGWYVEMRLAGYDEQGYEIGEPEQVQCEFCYTHPDSVFSHVSHLEMTIESIKAEKEKAVLEERERCAKIVETMLDTVAAGKAIANEIRKRK